MQEIKGYYDNKNDIFILLRFCESPLDEYHIAISNKNDGHIILRFDSYEEALENFIEVVNDTLNNSVGEESKGDSILIQDLDLSARAANCLLRAGLRTLSDIKDLTKFQLRRIRNLGVKSLEEIEEVVKEHGYELKEI